MEKRWYPSAEPIAKLHWAMATIQHKEMLNKSDLLSGPLMTQQLITSIMALHFKDQETEGSLRSQLEDTMRYNLALLAFPLSTLTLGPPRF